MRSNVALSVVIVVFGAVATSPQQLAEPILTMTAPAGPPAPPLPGDGPEVWIPIIYVTVFLVVYRLLSAPLERALERQGRTRPLLWVHVAALATGAAAGGYHAKTSMTYLASLSYLERPLTAAAQQPHLVARNAIVLGAVVYLATVLALLVAAAATAPPGTAPPGGRGRVFAAAGVADLAVCTAIGVAQNWGSDLASPLWPVGVGLAGTGLALALNLARTVPVPAPRYGREATRLGG